MSDQRSGLPSYAELSRSYDAALLLIAAAEADLDRLQQAIRWQPIETAPKDATRVLVALVRDGVIWRVSEAAFNGIGWYNKGGEACHWRTHWLPLPALLTPAAVSPR